MIHHLWLFVVVLNLFFLKMKKYYIKKKKNERGSLGVFWKIWENINKFEKVLNLSLILIEFINFLHKRKALHAFKPNLQI
ncbi:hypothetical protein CQA38_01235 [Campylobacter sp. MIT 12-5580]|nr:hypothetical protein CQA38_01235 [Campylobacter sp. MIT 12-5580]